MDQHNHNAKKLNVPMTVDDFVKNLRGCNGSGDFPTDMLREIYYSIRYVSALSAAFERASAPSGDEPDGSALVALSGLERCAALVARLSAAEDSLTVDSLLLTLCKSVTRAVRQESRGALSRMRRVVAARGCLMEAEDYLSPSGTVSLVREASRGTDSGLLSSIYSYIALGESGVRAPSVQERALIDAARECVQSCNLPALLITETKFLPLEALQELIRAFVTVGAPPEPDSLQLNPQLEDITIFFFELMGQTLIQNRRSDGSEDESDRLPTSVSSESDLSQSPQSQGWVMVSNNAIAYLQRALLAPALSQLGGAGWEACFSHVLLPLMTNTPRRPDTAARADTLMCKVFLQHLQVLGGRGTFSSLWTKIVRVQQSLLSSDAEPLREGALESLKNMLLVMHSVKIFNNGECYNELWYMTWDIIGEFQPTLKQELFPDVNDNTRPTQNLPSHMQPAIPHSLPTLIPVGANSTNNHPLTDTNRQSVVNQSNAQSSPIHIQSNILVGPVANSPVNLIHTPPSGPTLIAPTPITAVPGQAYASFSPVRSSGQNVAPINRVFSPVSSIPISGMVPIRNPLYDQSGLTSSVLLQPLNEMISTSIGISIQTQPADQSLETKNVEVTSNQVNENQDKETIPIESVTHQLREIKPIESTIHQGLATSINTTNQLTETSNQSLMINQDQAKSSDVLSNQIDLGMDAQYNQSLPTEMTQINQLLQNKPIIDENVQSGEIFAEYITNPYNDVTSQLFDPEDNTRILNSEIQKSFSANVTPMHSANKTQFGSTDNVNQSSIFNFSNYFGSHVAGSEVFDTLMSTQEG
ncbi:unnamed protein product [Leptidea sinapis]|uniref:Uncharacterized protein n=1 Tax=Leptidea sinapis TaxID=189913 RepID=A0A5E4R022_9NEOP|nr:unnamed protein product [Leptidea sinapis]